MARPRSHWNAGSLARFLAALSFAAAACLTVAAPGFSIREQNGIAWLVKPSGERFFSLGVCVVTQGAARDKFDPHNPGYASWQHYPDSNQWANATLKRLNRWGFTTVGGWSDFQALRMGGDTNLFFAPVLHIGSTAGAPWWDMWDPKIIERMHQVAREQILPLRHDPRVIGYYSDNEMGWWNAILFKMTLEQASTSSQRQRSSNSFRRLTMINARNCSGISSPLPTWRIGRISSIMECPFCVRTAMELPAKLFGRTQFKRGDEIQFASTLLKHGAAYRVDWKGKFTLAKR